MRLDVLNALALNLEMVARASNLIHRRNFQPKTAQLDGFGHRASRPFGEETCLFNGLAMRAKTVQLGGFSRISKKTGRLAGFGPAKKRAAQGRPLMKVMTQIFDFSPPPAEGSAR